MAWPQELPRSLDFGVEVQPAMTCPAQAAGIKISFTVYEVSVLGGLLVVKEHISSVGFFSFVSLCVGYDGSWSARSASQLIQALIQGPEKVDRSDGSNVQNSNCAHLCLQSLQSTAFAQDQRGP